MKRRFNLQNLIYIGFVLLLLGIILPLLMIMQYIKPTLWLEFLSYTISVLGLILGIVGMAYMVVKNKKKE